jgi:DNA-binding MarR family transcriptional regulator
MQLLYQKPLSTQLLTAQASLASDAWSRLLHTHAAISQEINIQLRTEHGLTINEFEVLLLLARAPERSLRRIDLANQVLLSPSGITRMLDRLGCEGLVEKGKCPADARVTYAVLTDAGMEKVRRAHAVQHAAVERLFGAGLEEAELEMLAELLGRLPGEDGDCSLPAD